MGTTLQAPLTLRLPKAAAKRLAEAGLETVEDLLNHAPRRYYQWGKLTDIRSLVDDEDVTLLVDVVNQNLVHNRSGNGVRLLVDVTDGTSRLTCTFFAKNAYMLTHHQRLLRPGTTVLVAGKVSEYHGKKQLVQPEFEEIEEGSPQDIARRAGRPIPIYRALAGLSSWKLASLIRSLLEQIDDSEFEDLLGTDIRAERALFTHVRALRMLHEPETAVDWQTARRTLAWEEALVLQTALRTVRMNDTREALPLTGSENPHRLMTDQLIGRLPFELTNSQKGTWTQIAEDLAQSVPMQRLLQADVGAGKTVVASLAMVRAVESGYQSVMLAPTEVLARQHYLSLTRILEDSGLDIPLHLLTSKRAALEKQYIISAVSAGEPCIVVGTHALLQEGVNIPNLALLVVDEQHRFGVAQREHLRQGGTKIPHLLVMTATPIPRTIAMTVFGDLDVIAMTGMPEGRKPVETFLVDQRNGTWMRRMWQRAREEVDRGGRVYVVCPRIDPDDQAEESSAENRDAANEGSIPSAVSTLELLRQLPEFDGIQIGLAHGRQSPEENAWAFANFASGAAPVLVATTVVEVGVDIPEATMMVILGGNRFGLSQLHQLRGRVGRSDTASICVITHPGEIAPQTAERLDVIASTNDGFELAEADLRLRREGDVLGKNQSGSVSSLRFLAVRRDVAIISGARKVAAEILTSDPTLAKHPGLAAAVRQRAGEELVWLERS